MDAWLDQLTHAGLTPVPLAFADGTRLVVLPKGGRLLGLFPPGSDANFLWTNPALSTPTAWRQQSGWPNPGGDRTWLAPEIELFISDLAQPTATYTVPPALDPGHWTVTPGTAAELSLFMHTTVGLQRARRDLAVTLRKHFSPAGNPLQGTPLAGRDLAYAGYRLATTLELAPTPVAGLWLGLWQLLQLPPLGTMLIPTRSATVPQVVFGRLADRELTVAGSGVRWVMAAPGPDTKIALKAAALTGRAGYLRATATTDCWELVVREFAVDTTGHYVDALWTPPHETGWAFQACAVRTGSACFNELEYHAPAVATATGGSHCRDESQVWAFRGPESAITAAAELLLGDCTATSNMP